LSLSFTKAIGKMSGDFTLGDLENRTMKAGKIILGYFLAGALFFYAFFLWQFPYDRLKSAWVQSFEEALPLRLSIGRMAPVLPWGLRLEDVRVGTDSLSFRLPDLVLRPDLAAFLTGKAGLSLQDAGSSARLAGTFRREKNKNGFSLRLNKAEVQALAGKETSFRVRLSGEGALEWVGEDWDKGDGQLWALLERGEFQGSPEAQIPLPLKLFDSVRGEIQFKEGMARVKRLEASGKENRFTLPQPIQIPLKGGALSPELFLLFQMTPK
jgi:type II secretion system protein N